MIWIAAASCALPPLSVQFQAWSDMKEPVIHRWGLSAYDSCQLVNMVAFGIMLETSG